MKEIVQVKNLTKFYGKTCGINDVSFDVDEGDFLAIVGPAKSGKSTLLRSLAGLIVPKSGNIKILDNDCLKDHTFIARKTGFVPQNTCSYSYMTARRFLKFSERFYNKDCTLRIRELSKKLNLDLDEKIANMAIRDQRKVDIIAGLVHSPRLILLDEPMVGLDKATRELFLGTLIEDNQDGATIIIATQDLDEVKPFCNRVAILKDEKLIEIIEPEPIPNNEQPEDIDIPVEDTPEDVTEASTDIPEVSSDVLDDQAVTSSVKSLLTELGIDSAEDEQTEDEVPVEEGILNDEETSVEQEEKVPLAEEILIEQEPAPEQEPPADNGKTIKVYLSDDPNAAKIEDDYFAIDGVSYLVVTENEHSFIYEGNLNALMKKIAAIEIKDFVIGG